MVRRNIEAGHLYFTSDLTSCLDNSEIVFSAVGTPSDEDGSADIRQVIEVARTVGRNMNNYLVFVTKSTVPVGTSKIIKGIISEELHKRQKEIPFDIASNPEFLKEGSAIKDFMSPDRVVVGVETIRAKELLERLYRPFLLNNFRIIFTDIPSAEMIKYAANSMLATRISFMNDIANLCELVGADINMVRKGIGSDVRIGTKFLYPGCGYGGSCFPKDVKALIKTAENNGYEMQVLKAVEEVNEQQKTILYKKLKRYYPELKGKIIAIWGLAFKPETDDMRKATSITIINLLLKAGVAISVYDPVAMNECKRIFGNDIKYGENLYDVLTNADALLLLTEWKQFRLPDWDRIKKSMKTPLILDGRNIYNAKELKEKGFKYEGIGC